MRVRATGEELPAGRTVGLVLPVADRAVVPPLDPPGTPSDAARSPIWSPQDS